MQYIVRSKVNEEVLASNKYNEIYDFVIKNQDADFRVIDHNLKTKRITKQSFLKSFYNSEKNLGKLFSLMEVIITWKTDISKLITEMKLNVDYRDYKIQKNGS